MAGALTKAGRYQIVAELGRGSMGVVYQGFDPVIGRVVAIKTILTEGLSTAEFEEYKTRFQREAQAAGLLNHPNIVTVYDFGEDNGVLYLAMEFLEGKSVQTLVEEQNILPVETIIPMYEQVCSALDSAHTHKIVHRDIKPANIMILKSGLVKVMDFGIAKMMSTGMTQAGQILGTPNYMSPEQVRGRAVDGRSDIFSLGVILYELVTGEKPFSGQNITTVIYKIINENPIAPRELDASIHPGLSYVISKALAKNPDERYQTCRELAEDLRNYKNLGGAPPPSATVIVRVPPIQATPVGAGRSPRAQALQPQAPPSVHPPVGAPPMRPMSVQVIPPVKPQPRQTSSAVWLLLVLFLVAGLGGGYYFFRYQQGRLMQESPTPTTPAPAPQEVTPPSPTEGGVPASSESAVPGATAPETVTPETTSPAQGAVAESKPEPAQPKETRPAEAVVPTPGPAKPAPAPKFGQLVVTSNLPGARITLDGKSDPGWVTPRTFSGLPAGTHTVVVAKEGYTSVQRRLTIEGGRSSTMAANLSTPSGEINIETSPPGVEVFIDGRSYGPSPVQASLPLGRHTYRLVHPGMDPYESSFELKYDGHMMRRTVSVGGAVVRTGIVEVRTIPPGATVHADGQRVGGTTPTSFRLPAGEHTLTISSSGFRPIQKRVDVPAGGSIAVNETFSRQ